MVSRRGAGSECCRHRRVRGATDCCRRRVGDAGRAVPSSRRSLPGQLRRVRAAGARRDTEVAHRRFPRRPAEGCADADATHRPRSRLPACERCRRAGDGAGGHVDRPRQHARAVGWSERPHGPDLFRAGVAARLPRTEAPRRAGTGARRAAAHRRSADLAQPLRPPRCRQRRCPRRASGRPAALHRADRRQGLVRRPRHRQRGRARLVAEHSRRRGRDRLHSRAALVGPLAHRPHGDPVGQLRDPGARLPDLLRRRHRVLEGLRRHPRILRGAPGRRTHGFDLALLPIGAYARAGS